MTDAATDAIAPGPTIRLVGATATDAGATGAGIGGTLARLAATGSEPGIGRSAPTPIPAAIRVSKETINRNEIVSRASTADALIARHPSRDTRSRATERAGEAVGRSGADAGSGEAAASATA